MAQYIDKSEVIEWVKKQKATNKALMDDSPYHNGLTDSLDELLSFLDTLKVKEVDLEKEFDNYAKDILACDVQFQPFTHLYNCAKYFYELGIKAQKGESVSEDLENHIKVCVSHLKGEITADVVAQAIRHGVRWEKDQIMKDANEALRTEYEKGRHDIIEKTLKWLWDLNQEHEIMSYTDSHVLDSEELQKYYKNNIEE